MTDARERLALQARLAERELDWLNQQEQIKDQRARLAEAERLLRMVVNNRCSYGVCNDEGIDAFLRPADSAPALPCPACKGTTYLYNGPTRVDCDECEGKGVGPAVRGDSADVCPENIAEEWHTLCDVRACKTCRDADGATSPVCGSRN